MPNYVMSYLVRNILVYSSNCVHDMVYAKQNQPVAVKKGTAKQSRINAVNEYD